jgi:hypothetical protein
MGSRAQAVATAGPLASVAGLCRREAAAAWRPSQVPGGRHGARWTAGPGAHLDSESGLQRLALRLRQPLGAARCQWHHGPGWTLCHV